MNSEDLDELFGRTLSGDYDDDLPWEAVRQLRIIGSREVFERAADWVDSDSPLRRARGADVLAQLGNRSGGSENPFPEECFSIISTLARREKDPLVLMSSVYALGHIGNPLA